VTGPNVVRVEPLGVELVVEDGETVMGAAVRAGYRWPNVCGGNGQCYVCRTEIISRTVEDPPLSSAEKEAVALGRLTGYGGATVRLACQVRPTGDMTLRKPGVRAPGAPSGDTSTPA
jgi:2Fe-2S ferredoxin